MLVASTTSSPRCARAANADWWFGFIAVAGVPAMPGDRRHSAIRTPRISCRDVHRLDRGVAGRLERTRHRLGNAIPVNGPTAESASLREHLAKHLQNCMDTA